MAPRGRDYLEDPQSWSPKERPLPSVLSSEPKDVIRKIRELAPDIRISTTWDEDPHFRWDGDGPDPVEEGFRAYDVTVTARSLSTDTEGNSYLGGSYSKPGEHDPDVHGYFLQMLAEALMELEAGSQETTPGMTDARKYVTLAQRHSYEQQRIEIRRMEREARRRRR